MLSRGKIVEVVLLACHSNLSRFGNFHISSYIGISKKLTWVLFAGSVCADKRNNTLGYCWGNLLVWEEKGKETIISLLLGLSRKRFLFHRKQTFNFSLNIYNRFNFSAKTTTKRKTCKNLVNKFKKEKLKHTLKATRGFNVAPLEFFSALPSTNLWSESFLPCYGSYARTCAWVQKTKACSLEQRAALKHQRALK